MGRSASRLLAPVLCLTLLWVVADALGLTVSWDAAAREAGFTEKINE